VFLDVRSRVAIAMGAMVAMCLLTGGLSWHYSAVASSHSSAAGRAAERAHWVSEVSHHVTAFMGEASDLAFGASGGLSEEFSTEYGDLVGADSEISRMLANPADGMNPANLERVADGWDTIRLETLVWVNAEAESGDSPARLKLMEDGQLRASISSNITTPASVANVTGVELRRLVRAHSEGLVDGVLRDMGTAAVSERDAAEALAKDARRLATTVLLVLMLATLMVSVGASVWLLRTIVGPLSDAKRTAERVAAGEYGAQFTRHSADEVGVLVGAIELMRDSVVSRINVMQEMAGAVLVTIDGVQEAAAAGDLPKVTEGTAALGVLADEMLRG